MSRYLYVLKILFATNLLQLLPPAALLELCVAAFWHPDEVLAALYLVLRVFAELLLGQVVAESVLAADGDDAVREKV
jgi:hypothetical protein